MPYVATMNVPGYLPMDDEPPTFETPAEAWWHLYHERCYAEADAPCDLCHDTLTHGPMGECDDDSETATELSKRARWAASGLVADFEAVGTVYGPTPGYDGDHDLGLAYSVTQTEEDEDDTVRTMPWVPIGYNEGAEADAAEIRDEFPGLTIDLLDHGPHAETAYCVLSGPREVVLAALQGPWGWDAEGALTQLDETTEEGK